MTTEPIQKPEDKLTQHIADILKERNHSLIKKIVYTIGVERTQEFLQKTLEIEAAGGMLTSDPTRSARRRSPRGRRLALRPSDRGLARRDPLDQAADARRGAPAGPGRRLRRHAARALPLDGGSGRRLSGAAARSF